MTTVARRPGVGFAARIRHDPALAAAVATLWLLLALFVVYPLAMLFARIFWDHGALTVTGLASVVTDRHQIHAFGNSLLLALLVGFGLLLIMADIVNPVHILQ